MPVWARSESCYRSSCSLIWSRWSGCLGLWDPASCPEAGKHHSAKGIRELLRIFRSEGIDHGLEGSSSEGPSVATGDIIIMKEPQAVVEVLHHCQYKDHVLPSARGVPNPTDSKKCMTTARKNIRPNMQKQPPLTSSKPFAIAEGSFKLLLLTAFYIGFTLSPLSLKLQTQSLNLRNP